MKPVRVGVEDLYDAGLERAVTGVSVNGLLVQATVFADEIAGFAECAMVDPSGNLICSRDPDGAVHLHECTYIGRVEIQARTPALRAEIEARFGVEA